jgi:hypothetical protein
MYQRRNKSGAKPGEDSLRGSKNHSTSVRAESGSKHNSSLHSNSLNIPVPPEKVSLAEAVNDKYKNYKSGKFSQEFYNKTMSLANSTVDRKELNSSIILRKPIPENSGRESKNGASSGLQDSGLGTATKRITTSITNSLAKRLEGGIAVKEQSTPSSFQKPPLQNSVLVGDKRRDISPGVTTNLDNAHKNRPSSNTSAANQTSLKDRRSNSFYQDKKKSAVNSTFTKEELQTHKQSSSVDPQKRTNQSSGSKRRLQGDRVYNYLHSIKQGESQLPPFEPSKTVCKDFDRIRSFAVNTHQGTVRAYNEDRVSILLNAQQR